MTIVIVLITPWVEPCTPQERQSFLRFQGLGPNRPRMPLLGAPACLDMRSILPSKMRTRHIAPVPGSGAETRYGPGGHRRSPTSKEDDDEPHTHTQ
jgi:hypothetical protein